MEFQIEIVRDEAGLRNLAPAWDRLLAECPNATFFASPAWAGAWWRHYGPEHDLVLVAARRPDGALAGLAPLMRSRTGSVRRLRFLGSGLADAGDFLLHPASAGAALEAILAALQRHARSWDLLDLDEVPPYSPVLTLLAAARPLGLSVLRTERTECPFIALPATWDAYLQSLQRKPRQHLQGFSRRFLEENNASFRLVTAPADVPAAVAAFYALHLARWEEKPDDLNPDHRAPAFHPFVEDLCTRAAEAGSLRLAELRVGDRPIASWISFLVNRRWSGYMTGFDPEWSRSRPGKILHGFVAAQAIAEGAAELDFGRGAEAYKYELGAVGRMNARVVLATAAPRSSLAFALATLRRQGHDFLRRGAGSRA